MIKKWGKRIAVFLSAVCGLTLLLVTGILSYLGTNPAHRQIQVRLNRFLPGSLSWSDPDISFWSGRFILKNLELRDPEGGVLATVEEAGVDVAVGDLASGELHVEKFYLTRPVLHVKRGRNGGINLLSAFPESGPAPADPVPEMESPAALPPVRVDEIRITGMSLFWKDETMPAPAPSGQGGAEGAAEETVPAFAEIRDFNLSLAGLDIRRPAGSFTASTGGGRIHMPGVDTAVRKVRLSVELDGEDLRITRWEGEADPGRFSLNGKIAHLLSGPDLDLTLELESDLAALDGALAVSVGITGTARARLAVSGPVSDPGAQFWLDIADMAPAADGELAGASWLPAGISLALGLENRVIRLTKMAVTGEAFSAAGTGRADLRPLFPEGFAGKPGDPDGISYSLELPEWRVRPAAFLAAGGNPAAESGVSPEEADLPDLVTGRLSASGRGLSRAVRRLDAKISAAADKITVQPDLILRKADVQAALGLQGDRLRVSRLRAALGGVLAEGSASCDLAAEGISADLDLTVPDLHLPEQTLPAALPGGRAKLTLRAGGTAARPEASLTLLAEDLSRAPLENGRISLAADLSGDGHLQITMLDLSAGPDRDPVPAGELSDAPGDVSDPAGELTGDAGRSRVLLTGSARLRDTRTGAWNKNPPVSLDISEGIIRLGDLLPDAAGLIRLSGAMNADLSKLQSGGRETVAGALSGELRLTGAGLEAAGFRLAELDASVRPGERAFHLTAEALFSPQARLALSGEYLPASGEFRFSADGRGDIPDLLGSRTPPGFSGKFRLQARGKGRAAAPEISLAAGFSGLTLKERPMPEISLDAAMNGPEITAHADAGFPVLFRLHTGSRKFSLNGDLEQVDLTPWLALSGRSDLTGKISAALSVEGGLDRPEDIAAVLDIAAFSLEWEDRPFIRSGPFQAFFREREIRIADADIILLDQGKLAVNGTGRLDGALDMAVTGSIPLELVQGFAPGLTGLTGSVDLTARLSGAAENPELAAELRPRDAGMDIPGLADPLSHVNGRISVTPNALEIHELAAKLGDGKIRVSGRAGLRNFLPETMAVRLKAAELPLAVPETADLLINGDIALNGPWNSARLEGRIMVLEGRYYKDIELHLMDAIRKKRTAPAEPKEDAENGFAHTTTWDLGVIGRNPLWVDNNMAAMSLSPELRVTGPLSRPRINGRAAVLEGVVTYQKRKFDIQKGVVDFIDPYSNTPELLIEAETLVRDWTIHFSATGPADQLVIRLSSEPAEQDADIMSLLLFEKTTAEMGKGGGESGSLTQMAADVLAERLQKDLGEAAGLDLVELKYTEGTEDRAGEGVRVAVGKQLSRRLAVKYGVQTKDGQTVQKAAAEYRLLENLLVSAFRDSGGGFGGELVYRLEFR
ncbi:MAG: hypothetical protein CSB33_03415 [Desulfobacterales bacterium]|nr:MAG: hypothetical protein CSB33_03415 [Desulfobacterales bacterium]